MPLSFQDVFEREAEAVNFRRLAVAGGTVAALRRGEDPGAQPARRRRASRSFLVEPQAVAVERHGPRSRLPEAVRPASGSNLTGLALSGGGMRSASFSLGVMQALDALSDEGEPRVIDAVDYLSAVSGGGYIGTSVVAGLMQEDYSFPFSSRLGGEEPPEMQHLRDFSNFLAPNGARDYLASAATVLRGLLVNAVIVLPVLLVLASLTVAVYPFSGGTAPFRLTAWIAGATAVLLFASAIYASLTYRTGSLRSRERLGRGLGILLAIALGAALFELQPFILTGMLAAGGNTGLPPSAADDGFAIFARLLPALAAVLMPAAALLISVGQKLVNVAKASLGEASWRSLVKKYASVAALCLAAVIVPLILWVAYLYLAFWAIPGGEAGGCGPATPAWLQRLSGCRSAWPFIPALGPVATAYLCLAVVLSLVCLLIGPNANSLHRLYRDRLSRAFLMERRHLGARNAATSVDTWKFSSLKPFDAQTGQWERGAAFAPYLLTNTAINLEGSKDLNKRGRNADTFLFSPLFIGSRSTGYVPTPAMEAAVPDLSLATAMATSGAAASANMGRSTVKLLTFSLSLLNIRLGYWLANPARLADLKDRFWRFVANIGTLYFAAETAGLLDERKLNVYLTDGGHIENLGIYELLRRRCRVIVAVDAEADPDMTFPSLVNLEVMARIDLGIRIELPWQALQESALGVTASHLHGSGGAAGRQGPHAAIGTIRYDEHEAGVLIYIKSSLSGDENDYILDYKRRNPTFPHETTLDQFFGEDQFEVYRALGFHAAYGLFSGADDFAKPEMPADGWSGEVAAALALLNVPPAMARKLLDRI